MYFTANTYTKEQLAAEYKRLAKKLHPDVVGGSESAFKAMKAEYDLISDGMFNGVWNRPPKIKQSSLTFTAKSQQQRTTYNITPEDVQAGIEFIELLVELFKKPKRK